VPVTPAPAATPVDDEATVPPLTIAEARSYLADVLKKRFKRRISKSTLTRSCYRLSREKVRCRVSAQRIGRARAARAGLAAAHAAELGTINR
jgi:hypothetical protein